MKICTFCKENKPLSSFNISRSKKDGLQTKCRECSKSLSREYYRKDRLRHVPKRLLSNKTRRRGNRKKLHSFLCSSSYMDCGLSNDPVCLEFDHVRGIKRGNISTMVGGGYSWKVILKEIEKCDVVCANCHRRRTAKQFGWYEF